MNLFRCNTMRNQVNNASFTYNYLAEAVDTRVSMPNIIRSYFVHRIQSWIYTNSIIALIVQVFLHESFRHKSFKFDIMRSQILTFFFIYSYIYLGRGCLHASKHATGSYNQRCLALFVFNPEFIHLRWHHVQSFRKLS